MMIHPQFDPIAISIGPVAIRWYALSYIVGFMLFLWLGRRRIKQGNTAFTQEMLDDFLTWGVLGVILGGRLGYILFYKFSYYLDHPLEMLKVWEGGMSFHGGFLGVVIAMWLFSRKHKISTLKTMDFVAPLVPLGLASGRIGNFINGELWGRITDINAFGQWASRKRTQKTSTPPCVTRFGRNGCSNTTSCRATLRNSTNSPLKASASSSSYGFSPKTASDRTSRLPLPRRLRLLPLHRRICPPARRLSRPAHLGLVDGTMVKRSNDCFGCHRFCLVR